MSAAAILAERLAWQAYVTHCAANTRRHGAPTFRKMFEGDAQSVELWRDWKLAYDMRRAAAVPFSRRQRRWSYR